MATAQIDNAESPTTDIPELEHKADAIVLEKEKEESSGAGEEVRSEAKEAEPVAKPSEADQEGIVDGVIEVAAVPEVVESQVGEAEAVDAQEEPEAQKETEPTAKEEGSTSVVVDGADGNDTADDAQSSSGIVRTATPGSRTSTPPPGTTLAAPKKFSAVNVTKKFLSKTSQPAVAPAAGSKLGVNGRASASPVPISTPSRLLSTKLTTAPLAKSSASPNPPPPGVTPASSASPWAKPTLLPEASSSDSSSLAQPAPRRSLANLAASIGQGQGITATKPVAWRAVAPEGTSRFGMSRDFPTAREIADGESRLGREIAAGKMQAQAAAQAQAAHNQALLKSLNMFTNVDSAHRWDDDDDEDDMIDFGDKLNLPPAAPPVEAPPAKPAQYVAADDFDRSWPRKAPVEISTTRRTDEPRDRVLFNANSNRLEPSLPRQSAPPAPTRLMSRGAEPSRPPPPSDRQLPPHQQPPPQAGNRALPPHMAGGMPERLPPPPKPPAAPVTTMAGRSSWGLARDVGRPAPEVSRAEPVSPVKPVSALPSRPTWEQQANAQATAQPIPPRGAPPPAQAAPSPATAPSPAATQPPTAPKIDDQTAEMHTAAERARLRREAEEAERSAAMERARKKAKELEERLGLKPAAPAAAPASAQPKTSAPPQPPVPTQPAILRRPIPSPASAPAPPPGLPSSSAAPPPAISPAASAPRPELSRQVDSSWRARPTAAELPKPAEPAVAEKPAVAQPRVEPILQAHAAAEPSLREAIQPAPVREAPPHVAAPPPVSLPPNPTILQRAPVVETVVRLPGQAILPESEAAAGKKESGFDSMLARIQAAMAEARLAPPSIAEVAILTQSALPAPPQPTQPQSRPPPPPSQPAEIFDVTQVAPPRTPPPAWRTYVVRVPASSSSAAKSPIPAPRLKAAETPLTHPQGWLLVFQPPLDLPQNSILADLLLPRPIYQQRFGRPVDTAPIVSISPRTLEPFERKKKRMPGQAAKALSEIEQPPTSAETLIAPSAGYGWQQAQASTPAAEAGPSTTAAPAPPVTSPPAVDTDKLDAPEPPPVGLISQNLEQLKKPRSPVPARSSPAAKAEKEGQFAQEAVTVGPIARSRPVEVKSGVRFMVSSELEGDSLLDEVNKMSLETVGEGWGGVEKEEVSLPKTPGSETPKTPPSLNSGQPTSPNGAGTPWNRSTPRGATQHDHLKSVWDQAGSTDASTRTAPTPTDLPLPPPLISIPSTQSAQSDASTPMYPSLNAPSSSEIIPSQPLPAAKLGYPSPSAFSPGAPSAHLGFMRPPVSPHGYMYHAPSPTDSAENYGSISGGRPNGGFSAPWSPAAFGASMTSPGYGYAGKQAPPHAPSPVDGKDAHYGFSQAAFSQQAGYGQAYGQQHHLGANAYARGVGAGTYAYGYAQQGVVAGGAGQRAGGRFGPHAQVQQPVNGDYAQGGGVYGVEGAGYYGAISGQQRQGQGQHIGQIHSPVYGAHPHAQQQHPQHQQGQGQYGGGGAGAVGQQIMRGGRKMW